MDTSPSVTINGAINNLSTCLTSATDPAAFSGNGLITFPNLTSAIVRADGGINNSSNYATLGTATGGTNVNNGQIILGGAGRTGVATIGTALNPAGAVTNSSVGLAAADGNGNITIGGGDGSACYGFRIRRRWIHNFWI